MSNKDLYNTFVNLIWANLSVEYSISSRYNKASITITIVGDRKNVKKIISFETIQKNKEIMWDVCRNLAKDAVRKLNE